MMKLKRKCKLTFIFLTVLIVIVIAIASIIEFKTNGTFEGKFIGIGLFLIALPIIGSLLFLTGLHQWSTDAKELRKEWGEIRASLIMIFNLLSGPASIFCIPLIIILVDSTTIFAYIFGILILLIELFIAIVTILINGGSKAVQSTKLGRKIQLWRNNWRIRLFEEK